jgi:hypothetical protein
MFEKLLSLLLHAKGGAVATVLVLGASGALVTATVENGLATTTITQPTTTTGSETTAGGSTTTTTTTTNPAILALFNRTKAEEDPTGTATGNGCSDAAHATNEQVKRVNDAYKTDHAAVQALSKDAAKTDENKKLVKDADNKIKGFRQEAVKAIHELFKSDECKGNDTEDEDVDNDDEDEGSTTGTTNGTTSTTTTTTTVAISGTDAKAIADAAIKAMDDEVANLKTKLEAPATTPATTNTNVAPGKSDKGRDNHDNKGKGKGHS